MEIEDWQPLPFEQMNEQDVREDVLGPLVRKLGYRRGSDNDILRELELRYPYVYVGRKNPTRDVPVRGKADYVLEAQKRVRWVLEAKTPSTNIFDLDHREQARSYAAHPEVGAAYYVLSNGRITAVYDAREAPDLEPILVVRYEELGSRFPELEGLLSPEAIGRTFPDHRAASGPPLAPGLRSIARIVGGSLEYTSASLPAPALLQMRVLFSEGAVMRNNEGKLVAHLRSESPVQGMQTLIEKLGYQDFDMSSDDTQISSDLERPTVFLYEARLLIPSGSEMLDMSTWQTTTLPRDVSINARAEASGVLLGTSFEGIWRSKTMFEGLTVLMTGNFSIKLG